MAKKVFIQAEENETKVSMTKKIMKLQLESTVKNPWTYVAMIAWGANAFADGKSTSRIVRNAVTAAVVSVVLDQGVSLILNKDLIKETGEE